MRESLILMSIDEVSNTRIGEREAEKKQQEYKAAQKEALKKKNLISAKKKYMESLTYREMYESAACWKTKEQVESKYAKLTSETSKRDAMKNQIKMRVLGLNRKDLEHSWSENGKMFSGDELKDHLVNEIIPKQNDEAPPTDGIRSATIRTFQMQLGTTACDAKEVKEKTNHNLIEEAREELKGRDIESLLQSYRAPKIDSEFIGERIEMRFNVREPGEDTTKDVWFKGVVLSIKRNNKVLI